MRRREVARVFEETVDTTEVEVCILGSSVTGVTVSTVDCVVDGTTGAAGGNETNVAVGAVEDGVEEASATTEAAAAILDTTITLETAVVAEFVTAVNVSVVITLNAGCANRLKTGSMILE